MSRSSSKYFRALPMSVGMTHNHTNCKRKADASGYDDDDDIVSQVSKDDSEKPRHHICTLVDDLCSDNDKIVHQTVRELLVLSEEHSLAESHRAQIMRAWGHAYVVGHMKKSILPHRVKTHQAYFLRDCFGLLLNLAYDERGRSVLAKYPGMMGLCLHAMQTYTGTLGVFCDVCGLLVNLCYRDDECRWHVVQSGVLKVVLGIMYQFPKSQTVQWSGVTVLHNLLSSSGTTTYAHKIVKAVKQAQGLVILRLAKEEFKDDTVIHQYATWCMQVLKKKKA